MSDCGRYVILYITKGAEPQSKIYYSDLNKVGNEIKGEKSSELLLLLLVSFCLFVCSLLSILNIYCYVSGILPMEKLIDNFDSSWDVSELTVCLYGIVCLLYALSPVYLQ